MKDQWYEPDEASESLSESKTDLAERYDQMLDRQFEGIYNYDNKAWRSARIVGIVLSISIGALSIISPSNNLLDELTTVVGVLVFSIGIALLLFSLSLSLVVLLSEATAFGLSTNLADALNQGEISAEDYHGMVNKGYSKSISTNIRVLEAKSRRTSYAFVTLISGLTTIVLGFSFIILRPPFSLEAPLIITVLLSQLYMGDYILNNRYSVNDSPSSE